MAEGGGYGSGNGGRAIAGCSCFLLFIGVTVLAIVFLLPMASGGAIRPEEVFRPWTAYISTCCCCLGAVLMPVAIGLIVLDPAGAERKGKWGR